MQIQTLVNVKYQVVIPKEARKKIKIKPGQRMDVEVVGEKVVFSPAKNKSLPAPYQTVRDEVFARKIKKNGAGLGIILKI